jgi:hypothetical protein
MSGNNRIAFWGVVQKYFPFIRNPVRRSLRKSFPVVPLIDDMDELDDEKPEDLSVTVRTLKQHVKYLELLLRDYIVSDYPLREIAKNSDGADHVLLDIK